jgi:anti-sigma regulatory factor (Ser/Thr protein kinase)
MSQGGLGDPVGVPFLVGQGTVNMALSPEPRSARLARAALVKAGLDPDLEHTVALLTTELLANCIKHAGDVGDIHLAATMQPGFARVEILDAGPGFNPQERNEGFGLRLVDKLASRWGVERGRGTLVWFEVDRRRRRFGR